MSYTKGPWHLRQRMPNNPHEYVVQHENESGAFQEVVVINVGDEFQAPNQLADGHLISAAPELLEAAQRVVGIYNTPYIPSEFYADAIEQLKAAIVKAGGRA